MFDMDMVTNSYLVIPDVHGRNFWRSAVKARENMDIVFLGDYLDPYRWEGISPADATREFKDIIDFKKQHMDNVTLLLGNHDLGYLDPRINTCRRDRAGALENRNLISDNLELFDIVRRASGEGKDILFSHAGVRTAWVESFAGLWGEDGFNPETLNEWLHSSRDRSCLFRCLASVSYFRGGSWTCGSPVWADVNEYVKFGDFLPGCLQVFGHTLHDGGPIHIRGEADEGLCLDCAEAFVLKGDGSLKYPC